MQRYAQAWIQRVSQERALSRAQTACASWVVPEERDWADGIVSLLPAHEHPLPLVGLPDLSDWTAFSLWMPSGEQIDWLRAELFWRMLSGCTERLIFEVAGNRSWVRCSLRCLRKDASLLRAVFTGLYPKGSLLEDSQQWWKGSTLTTYVESVGIEPAKRLTLPESLPDSPLWVLAESLLAINESSVGFFQCIAQPAGKTDHWHREIEAVHDLAFLSRLSPPVNAWQRMSQPLPSGELRTRAEELFKKANPDQPFFGVSVRSGILNASDSTTDCGFLSAFRVNGAALRVAETIAPPPALLDAFFRAGISCRSGLLLNSGELSGLAHPLPGREDMVRKTDWPLYREDVNHENVPASGSLIGHATMTGMQIPVRIPHDVRSRGTHVVSSAGMGKTTLLKSLFLQDVEAGWGAVYLDPHGDAIHDLMGILPEKEHARCIYFNPGDPDWVAQWNPLSVPDGTDRYRVADDMLSALERVSHDWGDRLATVLRHALVGLLHLPSATMHDLYNVVRQKSVESDRLRTAILKYCPDRAVRDFWERDFVKSYREADLAAPRHKLLRLVSGGAVSRMFSQKESKLSIPHIMNTGQILLVDLSQLGSETREFLGAFLLTLFMVAAMNRSGQAREERKPFSVFADEAHLFMSADAFENMIAQARKFRVNLVLAHQYLKQFKTSQVDALLTAGTTIVGRVDRNDAGILAKDFQGRVKADDISALPPFEMVGRIGTDIARFRILPEHARPDKEAARRIIAASRERFYVKADTVVKRPPPMTSGELTCWEELFAKYKDADLSFDELEEP